MLRLATRLFAAALLVGGMVASGAAPAAASCALPRATSAHAFTGTVLSVELSGRIAHVKTDDGRTVVVRGTDATAENDVTTVDRTYEVGARYEFHPTNATDPYQDNACTATHEIAAPAERGSPPGAPDPRGGPSSSVIGAAVLAAGALGALLGVWLLRRRAVGARATAPRRG